MKVFGESICQSSLIFPHHRLSPSEWDNTGHCFTIPHFHFIRGCMSLFLSPRDILNASSSFPEVMGSMALASPHFPQIYFSRFPVIIPLCSSFFFPVSFFCKCPMLPVILSNVRVSFLTLLGKSTSTRVLRITAPPHTLKFLEFPFLCSFFPALLRGSGVSTGPSSACHHSSGEAHANYLALSKMLVTDYTAANIMPS